MQSSPSLVYVPVIVSCTPKAMRIALQLITPSHMLKVVDTHTLIDSGIDIFCIDWQFVRKYSLPTMKLDIPIKV